MNGLDVLIDDSRNLFPSARLREAGSSTAGTQWEALPVRDMPVGTGSAEIVVACDPRAEVLHYGAWPGMLPDFRRVFRLKPPASIAVLKSPETGIRNFGGSIVYSGAGETAFLPPVGLSASSIGGALERDPELLEKVLDHLLPRLVERFREVISRTVAEAVTENSTTYSVQEIEMPRPEFRPLKGTWKLERMDYELSPIDPDTD
jgi:hypothetical protein